MELQIKNSITFLSDDKKVEINASTSEPFAIKESTECEEDVDISRMRMDFFLVFKSNTGIQVKA
jgi:hypothetical protein